MTAHLPEFPAALARPGDDVSRELVDIISGRILDHPRSQQKRIGPSEIGHPCPRKLGYKLGGFTERPQDAAWLPTVGTAVHSWLEEALDAYNLVWAAQHGQERFLVEQRVSVGEINGQEITGSADAYDRVTQTVIDWKIVGPTTLRKYKAKGPGSQYRVQAHSYGRGFTRAGIPVSRVMIVFLPRNGELTGAYIWSEPFDEQVAIDALQRVNGIAITVDTLGAHAYRLLDAVESYCAHCPYLVRGSTDPATGCPGAATDTTTVAPVLTIT